MQFKTFQQILFSGAVAVVVGGCSRGTSPGDVPTFEVRGKVVINGQTAKGASVVLLPVEDQHKDAKTPPSYLIGGITDENGEFTLRTNGMLPGAPAGGYLVGVSWPDPSIEPDRDGGERGRDLVPEQYRDPRSSGIEFEVQADPQGRQELIVELKP